MSNGRDLRGGGKEDICDMVFYEGDLSQDSKKLRKLRGKSLITREATSTLNSGVRTPNRNGCVAVEDDISSSQEQEIHRQSNWTPFDAVAAASMSTGPGPGREQAHQQAERHSGSFPVGGGLGVCSTKRKSSDRWSDGEGDDDDFFASSFSRPASAISVIENEDVASNIPKLFQEKETQNEPAMDAPSVAPSSTKASKRAPAMSLVNSLRRKSRFGEPGAVPREETPYQTRVSARTLPRTMAKRAASDVKSSWPAPGQSHKANRRSKKNAFLSYPSEIKKRQTHALSVNDGFADGSRRGTYSSTMSRRVGERSTASLPRRPWNDEVDDVISDDEVASSGPSLTSSRGIASQHLVNSPSQLQNSQYLKPSARAARHAVAALRQQNTPGSNDSTFLRRTSTANLSEDTPGHTSNGNQGKDISPTSSKKSRANDWMDNIDDDFFEDRTIDSIHSTASPVGRASFGQGTSLEKSPGEWGEGSAWMRKNARKIRNGSFGPLSKALGAVYDASQRRLHRLTALGSDRTALATDGTGNGSASISNGPNIQFEVLQSHKDGLFQMVTAKILGSNLRGFGKDSAKAAGESKWLQDGRMYEITLKVERVNEVGQLLPRQRFVLYEPWTIIRPSLEGGVELGLIVGSNVFAKGSVLSV
jgi:hypothetical protein|eukprot:Stramenopile-MAST_4_protein_3898